MIYNSNKQKLSQPSGTHPRPPALHRPRSSSSSTMQNMAIDSGSGRSLRCSNPTARYWPASSPLSGSMALRPYWWWIENEARKFLICEGSLATRRAQSPPLVNFVHSLYALEKPTSTGPNFSTFNPYRRSPSSNITGSPFSLHSTPCPSCWKGFPFCFLPPEPSSSVTLNPDPRRLRSANGVSLE